MAGWSSSTNFSTLQTQQTLTSRSLFPHPLYLTTTIPFFNLTIEQCLSGKISRGESVSKGCLSERPEVWIPSSWPLFHGIEKRKQDATFWTEYNPFVRQSSKLSPFIPSKEFLAHSATRWESMENLFMFIKGNDSGWFFFESNYPGAINNFSGKGKRYCVIEGERERKSESFTHREHHRGSRNMHPFLSQRKWVELPNDFWGKKE